LPSHDPSFVQQQQTELSRTGKSTRRNFVLTKEITIAAGIVLAQQPTDDYVPLSIALVLYKLAEFFYLQLPECPSPHGVQT